MKYYPIFLHVDGLPCLVVGGGQIATRKVGTLVAAGARVVVVSPRTTRGLSDLGVRREIEIRRRPYETGDLDGMFLAYAATSDDELHERIWQDAQGSSVMLNVVDRPQWCNFIVPSVAERGDLTVAVSTSGRSPALARRIRLDIEELLGPEYERALTLLSRLRTHLREAPLSVTERRRIFDGLLGAELLANLRAPDCAAVDRLLAEFAGDGVSIASLGASLD
jgi:precorrin-2 dehydrogenase/sirohydrochlorin ferrochelatase